MENKTLEKVLDVAGSAAKVAANLSEKKEPQNIPLGDSDNSNNASTGSQNIQIHMDAGKKKEPKPVEKHIHEFPENRSLSEIECQVAMKKAEMDYDIRKSDQVFQQKALDREWEHRLEVERKNEKKGKIRRIIGGILVAVGASAIGYSIYSDYRSNRVCESTPKALPETSNVNAEGTVK